MTVFALSACADHIHLISYLRPSSPAKGKRVTQTHDDRSYAQLGVRYFTAKASFCLHIDCIFWVHHSVFLDNYHIGNRMQTTKSPVHTQLTKKIHGTLCFISLHFRWSYLRVHVKKQKNYLFVNPQVPWLLQPNRSFLFTIERIKEMKGYV